MQAGVHHIRRIRWQIGVSSTTTAFALRRDLRAQLDTVLFPAFERAFERLNTGEAVVHVPRLTLKLQLQLDDGEDLVAAMAKAIEEQVARSLPRDVAAGSSRAKSQWFAPESDRRRLFLDYLAGGRIAWYAASGDVSDLVRLLRDEAHALAVDPRETLAALGSSFDARVAASFRLFQLLDPTPRAVLLQRIAGDDPPIATSLRAVVRRLKADAFIPE